MLTLDIKLFNIYPSPHIFIFLSNNDNNINKQYVKAYQEDAEARTKYFKRTMNFAVKPALYVAFASCLWIMYKDVKGVVDKYRQ